MRNLRIFLIILWLACFTVWSILAFYVPSWVYSMIQQDIEMPPGAALAMTLSNHVRTPIGLFFGLCFTGMLLLLFAVNGPKRIK